MSETLLEIKDLHASVDDKEIIKGLNLTIKKGEVHAIMGPNGAGKSSLSYVLSGKDGYKVTSGSVLFKGKNLLEMTTEERACNGLFLSMQYPTEIPGVVVSNFLKQSLNSIRKYNKDASYSDFKPSFTLHRFIISAPLTQFCVQQVNILSPFFSV